MRRSVSFLIFEKSSGSLLFDGLGYSLILGFCLAFLTHVLALTPGSLGYRILSFWPVAYLGRISSMMYLLHSTCIMVSVKYLNGYSHILSRLVALASTILLSSLSWRLIEKRLLKAPAQLSAR
jgi:peptidoglycan/LPS O-acetylase OafA/YrhL